MKYFYFIQVGPLQYGLLQPKIVPEQRKEINKGNWTWTYCWMLPIHPTPPTCTPSLFCFTIRSHAPLAQSLTATFRPYQKESWWYHHRSVFLNRSRSHEAEISVPHSVTSPQSNFQTLFFKIILTCMLSLLSVMPISLKCTGRCSEVNWCCLAYYYSQKVTKHDHIRSLCSENAFLMITWQRSVPDTLLGSTRHGTLRSLPVSWKH